MTDSTTPQDSAAMSPASADNLVRATMRREFAGRLMLAAIWSAVPMIVFGIIIGVLLRAI